MGPIGFTPAVGCCLEGDTVTGDRPTGIRSGHLADVGVAIDPRRAGLSSVRRPVDERPARSGVAARPPTNGCPAVLHADPGDPQRMGRWHPFRQRVIAGVPTAVLPGAVSEEIAS